MALLKMDLVIFIDTTTSTHITTPDAKWFPVDYPFGLAPKATKDLKKALIRAAALERPCVEVTINDNNEIIGITIPATP